MSDYTKIQQLARQMFDAMEQRESGDKRTEWFLKDGSPDWMRDVVFAGGNDTSFKIAYEFAYEALSAICNANDDEDSIQDAIHEIEADIYTAELTAWLAENVNHVYFLTDALENFGCTDGFQLLAIAQSEHKQQVANAVLEKLIELADEPEDDSLVPDTFDPMVALLDFLSPSDFDYDWRADHNTYPMEHDEITCVWAPYTDEYHLFSREELDNYIRSL